MKLSKLSKLPEIFKNEFHKNSLIYLSASVLSSFFTFILIAPMSSHLSKYDMGIIEMFLTITTLLTGLITYSLDILITRNFTAKDTSISFAVILKFFLINSIVISTVFLILKNFLFKEIPYDIIWISILYSIANTFYSFYLKYLQLQKKAIRYAITVVSYSLINFGISILLIIILDMNFLGRIVAYSFPLFIILPYVIYYLKKQDLKKENTEGTSTDLSKKINVNTIYKLGSFLFIGTIASWVLERADRVILGNIGSIEDVGVYGVGYQLGAIVCIVQSAVSRAWLPNLIKEIEEGNQQKIKKDIIITILLLLGVTVAVCLCSIIFLHYFVNEKFSGAFKVIIIISFAYFIDGIWKLYNGFIIYHNKYTLYTTMIIASGIVNILSNFFLIPIYSIDGAAYSFLISAVFGCIISFYICKKNKWI